MHTIHRLCRDCIGQNLPQVSIARGDQGFGFTICSDCPPRVQALDPGGPAQRSGLCQGDSVLQLNGLPVETWKCADLAHAIRSCPSQIVLVVWRGSPEVRAGCDSWLRPSAPSRTTRTTTRTSRKLLPVPAHSKHGRRWAQGSMVRSGLGALGALWKDRKEEHQQEEEEEEEEEVPESPPRTATLKGTRVTSSNGDNYIILSPVDPGGQVLQPLYQDATMGRLYQTRGARGQGLLQDPRSTSPAQAFALAPPPAAAPPTDYGDYQNCTLVQSHLPSYADYGAFVSPAPKTLIFPIFVQPLDLCSPDRTLLMLEEMFVHQAQLPPAKVTVLIYTDLLLLTREDEAGRCNVLQSPVYLNTLQLQEVPSEPLLIRLLQSAAGGGGGSCWRLLLTLEALSMEQKLRVSLCLHDNSRHRLVAMETACSQHRLVAMETGCSQQLSHLPSDFGLLALGQSDIVYRGPSPYSSLAPPPGRTASSAPAASLPRGAASPPPSLLSPVWKERGRMGEEEEEEERQQGEGESASETSESLGGAGGRGLPPLLHQLLVHEEDEEEGEDLDAAHRAAALRRSLSEGSLLREPRSPRFLSDSTIHRLIRPAAFDPCPSSAESDSLRQVLLLLNGTQDAQLGDLGLKRNKNLAADIRNRLPFLRRRKNSYHGNSFEKALRNNRASVAEALSWAQSLETLLANQNGRAVFRNFLRSEFSEENLDFWLAVERFKRTHSQVKMAARAAKIYREFISAAAVRQVNVDSAVRESTDEGLRRCVGPASFQLAQDQIFSLMESDSYPRFLKSRLYTQLAEGRATPAAAAAGPPLCSAALGPS